MTGTGILAAEADLLTYDLEDLSQIPIVENAVTLTPADPKEIPASVTTITFKDIKRSGARNLDELLEIYVPGFFSMYKVEGNQIGMRGIISDRNNKILMLVNGKKMNITSSDAGVVTERWFTLLGDIRRITVINGPGSAVYGAGAIAGVISIETFDGSEHEGVDVTLQGGLGEDFGALQMRYGYTFEDGSSVFGYYGIDSYRGADEEDAPHKLAFDLVNRPWLESESIAIKADERIPFATTNDNASFQDKIRHKLHLQYKGENFELWTRYTKSGLAIPTLQGYYRALDPEKLRNTGTINQQWTTVGKYSWQLSENWDLEGMASYMVSDMLIDIAQDGKTNKNWKEEELNGKLLAHYSPEDERDSIAVGIEYRYTHFGEKSNLGDEPESLITGGIPAGTTWHSNMFSIFGEYQKHFASDWTIFAGLRMDKHTYTDWMISPRLSAVYVQDASKVFKLTYNRSVRHSDDADLYKHYQTEGEVGDLETIDNIEFIVDYDYSKMWHMSFSTYYNHHRVVAYNDAIKETGRIGILDFYGLEGIIHYHRGNMDLILSHNYTKQLDFKLNDPETLRQNISASVKGYGNDLANWPNHITKLNMTYKINPQITWNSSLRIYWGLPGAIDMAHYNMDNFSDEKANIYLRLPLYSDSERAFEESIFFNTSVTYRYSDAMTFALYGYDLIGLFDQSYNKRNYFQRTSHYRETAPSLSVRMTYHFD
jgi:outer membrane receptor for ferrienterochelin and colicin